MRHIATCCACVLGLCAASALAQDSKPNFSGNWQLNAGKSELHSGKTSAVKLTIEQKGSSIHVLRTITGTDGKQTVTEFNCTTDGEDCDSKGAKISLWYDGGDLVEMDFGNDSAIKMKMSLAPDGKTITCESTFINPQADADKLVLEKL